MLFCRPHARSSLQPRRQSHSSPLVCHAEKPVEDMLVLELKEELRLRQLSYGGTIKGLVCHAHMLFSVGWCMAASMIPAGKASSHSVLSRCCPCCRMVTSMPQMTAMHAQTQLLHCIALHCTALWRDTKVPGSFPSLSKLSDLVMSSPIICCRQKGRVAGGTHQGPRGARAPRPVAATAQAADLV